MMLVFDHVCVFYGDTPVLRELSFQVRSGEQVGLIGANGAGKSTLMKAALGLLPYAGSITVDGTPVTRKTLPEVRRKLGYVLQDADNQMFMPTVYDDMMFGLLNYGMSKVDAERRVDAVLEQLDLTQLKNKYNHKISGGEKRMAAIATVLAMEPEVIIMDEPSVSLDPYNRRAVINVINSLTQTKIIASHDLDMIMETCRRVILISDGQIVASGDTDEILRNKQLLETNRMELPFSLSSSNN